MLKLAPALTILAAAAARALVPDEVARSLAAARATPAEMRWRLVPWMRSLTAALARARRENKPVFYFGYDGVLDTGNS